MDTMESLINNISKAQNVLDDSTQPELRVINPHSTEYLQELKRVRDASRELQKKRDDEMKKAAEAAVRTSSSFTCVIYNIHSSTNMLTNTPLS
ncbi:hypothetical protein RR46_01697 [Papilio xuthus]|uniref:Uncharacterized protein n=1 Tax=Papilio xuthus TaxID=66420 RepID=A0A0N0PAD1_PAPXU|nr:hypothetical protein RR46_01697 [Papilio xuthus]